MSNISIQKSTKFRANFCSKTKSRSRIRLTTSETDAVILDFFSSLKSSARALTCWMLYASGEHEQLRDLEVNANDYDTPFGFRDAYAATNFLSKAKFLKGLNQVDREKAAIQKFFFYEAQCADTNFRLNHLLSDSSLYTSQNALLFHSMTRKIEEILGDFDPEEFVNNANWGPGTSTEIKGRHANATNKFQSKIETSSRLYQFVSPWFRSAYPLWAQHSDTIGVTIVDSNQVTCVSKNSKIDRVIAIEPGLNLWFQKAIGTMIRERLRNNGIDLKHIGNSKTRKNSHFNLARIGSLDASLATVDFSSASDTISIELVRQLLPPKWFLLLDICRSHHGQHNGEMFKWNKFSSMGNGFTFELESLIFYAAALAVQEYKRAHGIVSVYGDDVILPTCLFECFSEVSKFLGFSVNKKKSHFDSPFRESCGSHWFRGIDCQPSFLKEILSDEKSIYKLANNVRLLSHRRNSYYGCDSSFRRCWSNLARRLPSDIRLMVPAGFGDIGLISNFDEACPSILRQLQHGHEGYSFTGLVDVAVKFQSDNIGLLLNRYKGISTSNDGTPFITSHESQSLTDPRPDVQERGNYTPFRGVVKSKIKRLSTQTWYDLGPWF